MLAHNYNADGYYTGSEKMHAHPLEKGEWLLPAGATTTTPPQHDPATQECMWKGGEWKVTTRPVIEVAGESVTVRTWAEYQQCARTLLGASDSVVIRFTFDGDINIDPAKWRAYRMSLRDILDAVEGDATQPLPETPYLTRAE